MDIRHFTALILIILILVCAPVFQKQCLGVSEGQICNIEAQNIVNTSDLLIKAEHAYFQNNGMFAGLRTLEQSNPAYLSPIPVVGFNNEGCIEKILSKKIVYICINLQGGMLDVFIPENIAYSDLAFREISKGITGKTGQISYAEGLADISFSLKSNPPSFASDTSNPDGSSPLSSTLTSPNPNGGTDYVNTVNQNSPINRAIDAVAGFFAAVFNLF